MVLIVCAVLWVVRRPIKVIGVPIPFSKQNVDMSPIEPSSLRAALDAEFYEKCLSDDDTLMAIPRASASDATRGIVELRTRLPIDIRALNSV